MNVKQRLLVPTHLTTREKALPVNVTGRSEREVERVLRGMLINCHEDWFIDDVMMSEPVPSEPHPTRER